MRTYGALLIGVVALAFGCNKKRSAPKPSGDGSGQTAPSPRPSDPTPRTPGAKAPGLPAKVIYLARHGQTYMNHKSMISGQIPYDSLNSVGFKQRVGLFALLHKEPIQAIITSTLLRARQTAAPLVNHFKLQPMVVPELSEFRGGILEGICYDFMRKRPKVVPGQVPCDMPTDEPLAKLGEKFIRAEMARAKQVGLPYHAPGGGENLFMVSKRLEKFLARFPKNLADKTVLIVGHSGSNRFLLANLMGWDIKNARRVRQDNGVVLRLERRGAGQPPELKAFASGRWQVCGKLDPKKGLACMKNRPKKKPGKAPGPGMAPAPRK